MNPTSVCLRLALTGAGIASYFPARTSAAHLIAIRAYAPEPNSTLSGAYLRRGDFVRP